MNQIWFCTISSVIIVSLISLIGVISLAIKKELLQKILLVLVSFAAGSLLGGALIHLLPEAVAESDFTLSVSLYLLAGIVVFFILEKFIAWRHCHIPTSEKHPHPVGIINLIGDALHNFIDGMIIAASFLVSIPLGIATSLAVIFHEIPQEIGDFGVLIYAGFSRTKALLFNFLSAIFAILGAIIVLLLNSQVPTLTQFLIPFTAGSFIYIAASDLIPELHKETKPVKSLLQLIFFLLGIGVMILLLYWE